MVAFRHVFKVYRVADTGVVALGGVDLEIDRGEFLAVVGPSGSGKSTILNLIGGLDTTTAGEVEVDGVDLARLSDEELTRYRRDAVGFVWQGTARNLVPYLTLRENVRLPQAAGGQATWTGKRTPTPQSTTRAAIVPPAMKGPCSASTSTAPIRSGGTARRRGRGATVRTAT